ncbi:uncharacterized protein LOC134831260 [Culicoides brevitarsis]|uniref:uncharacterized protein LOC134831260 n=1 Tax=Culicoides brevitarsis TaxID=469753 RepID=UPI00307C6232
MESGDKNNRQDAGSSSEPTNKTPERSVTFLDKGVAKVMKVSKGHKVIIMNNENGEQEFIAIPASQDINLDEVLSFSAGTQNPAMPPSQNSKKNNFDSWQPACSSTQLMSQELSPIKPLANYLEKSLEIAEGASENVPERENPVKIVSLNERNDWSAFKTPQTTQATSENPNTEPAMEVDQPKNDEMPRQTIHQTVGSLTSTLAGEIFAPESPSQSMVVDQNTILPVLPPKIVNTTTGLMKSDSEDSDKDSPAAPEVQPVTEKAPEEPEEMEEEVQIDLSLPPADAEIWKELEEIQNQLRKEYFGDFDENVEEKVEIKEPQSDLMSAPKSQKTQKIQKSPKRKPMPKSKRPTTTRTRSRTILDSDFDDKSQPMLKHVPRI